MNRPFAFRFANILFLPVSINSRFEVLPGATRAEFF